MDGLAVIPSIIGGAVLVFLSGLFGKALRNANEGFIASYIDKKEAFHMAERQNSGNGLMKGAVIGATIGAAAALLLAPKAGRELRGDIRDTYIRSKDKTRQLASEAGAKTQEVAHQVVRHASDLAGKTRAALQSAKDDAQTAMAEEQKPN